MVFTIMPSSTPKKVDKRDAIPGTVKTLSNGAQGAMFKMLDGTERFRIFKGPDVIAKRPSPPKKRDFLERRRLHHPRSPPQLVAPPTGRARRAQGLLPLPYPKELEEFYLNKRGKNRLPKSAPLPGQRLEERNADHDPSYFDPSYDYKHDYEPLDPRQRKLEKGASPAQLRAMAKARAVLKAKRDAAKK